MAEVGQLSRLTRTPERQCKVVPAATSQDKVVAGNFEGRFCYRPRRLLAK